MTTAFPSREASWVNLETAPRNNSYDDSYELLDRAMSCLNTSQDLLGACGRVPGSLVSTSFHLFPTSLHLSPTSFHCL